jgi:alkanesulfonate monooxygenase SsuD/methylene tetrahydromethanopterin reductase-like flavin-dependent oxidoreductase (luciferase family)
MKIGIMTYAVDLAALAKRAEELGFNSLWAPEHNTTPVHIAPMNMTYRMHLEPDGMPQPLYRSGQFVDPFIALARASAVTTTITLGTGVCLIPEHNPLLLAKQVATLDNFSGGRFIFGVGAGWLREETQIMGGDYDHRWWKRVSARHDVWQWLDAMALHAGANPRRSSNARQASARIRPRSPIDCGRGRARSS